MERAIYVLALLCVCGCSAGGSSKSSRREDAGASNSRGDARNDSNRVEDSSAGVDGGGSTTNPSIGGNEAGDAGNGDAVQGGSDGGIGTPSGAAPLPNDPRIYGSMADGAFYLFRMPYITVTGSPPRITRAVNVDNPGTRDLAFEQSPLYLENGGPDGRPCAQFDGVDDFGSATGFNYAQDGANEPALQVVGSYDDTSGTVGAGAALRNASNVNWYDSFVHVMHCRTLYGGDLWRANAHPVGVPHNIDWGHPGAESDTAPHLHETLMYATGMVAFYDGQMFGPAGDQGIMGSVNELWVARSAEGGFAPVRISEVVVTEGRTVGEAEAYRSLRIRLEYPSLLQ